MDAMSNEIIVLDSSTTMTRRFLVSQSGLSEEELEDIRQEIVHLKGVAEVSQNHFNSFCTHIISKDFPVTEKILGALASGKWLLSPRYIHDCYKAKKWLGETDYELPNYNFAARYHRMGRINRSGAGIYKNLRVYIKLAQKSYARAFRRVMAAGEADVLLKEDIHRADLVITDMQHYEIISQQLPNSNIVGIDFIKDTLVQQIPLVPLERFFLKKAARSQETPRKSEAGPSNQRLHSQNGSNTGYTPTKLLHIKKEPDDGTKAVASPSHIMRKSIKKIPFTPKNYRNISTYFKTENKEKVVKIEPSENIEACPNQSINGEHRRQATFGAMPSSSGHYQTADTIEIMMDIPNKKRKDSACEIIDITTPFPTKSKGATFEIIDITTPLPIRAKGKTCEIVDITTPIPIKTMRTMIKTDIDLTQDLSPRIKSTFTKRNSSKNSPHIPMIIDSPAVSPGSAKSFEKDPESPIITRKTIARASSISTGLYSRRRESLRRASSSISPVPVGPGGSTMYNPSPGGSSSSGMSLGSTPSPPTSSLSTMELCGTSSEDQGSSKGLCAGGRSKNLKTASTSSFSGFSSPERLQRVADNNKQRDLSEEGEMELSYSPSSFGVDHPSISNNMDVDDDVASLAPCDVSLKRPSPHKGNRRPLTPIDMANGLDPSLPQYKDRLAPKVMRKKHMNSLVLTFMHKVNNVNRTVFSETTNLCTHHDIEVNLYSSAPPREMTIKETALYESSMDDTLKVQRRTIKEQEIILQGIEYLYVALTPEAFPPPKILGHLLRRLLWQENRFPIIHSRALTLVNRVLDFHPPSSTHTRTLYLSTLRCAGSTEEQVATRSWDFIKEIISSALEMDDDQTDYSSSESSSGDEMIYKSMNSVRLLEFIQTLLQEDLRNWDNSPEGMRYLICTRIFWGDWGEQDRSLSDTSEILKVSPQIKRLLHLWVRSSQAPSHISELIARLVGVVIHLMWRCSDTPLLPVSPLPDPLLPLAKEILIRSREVSGSQNVSRGFELLQLIQDLPDPWQRTVVLTIIFKSVTASPNIKFSLADLLDYGKLVGQEQEAEQKITDIPNSASKRNSKSNKSTRSSARCSDYLSPHKVNKTNFKGETKLLRACISNNVEEMCKLLDVPGIDVNKADHNGTTALHEAAIRGHDTCVKMLLDFKPKHTEEFHDKDGQCDIMKRDTENGMTALHDAVSENMVESVKLILEYGGDELLKVKTRENKTAYDLVVNEEMCKILDSYKGKIGKYNMIKETREWHKSVLGLQLNQLSHSSLLSSREECQAFILLLLNNYLNTTGFRFLSNELKTGLRRSTSMEHKQSRAQLKNNDTFSSTSHELSCGKNQDINTDEKDDHFRSHVPNSVNESLSSTGDKRRELMDINCENNKDGKLTNETAFTMFRRKKAENIPMKSNYSQHMKNCDFLLPSDEEEERNMNNIFSCYSKDLNTFEKRKEEYCKDLVDSEYLNSLNFILQ